MMNKQRWAALGLVVGGVLLAACGGLGSDSAGLPALDPTQTALPLSTPTDIPAPMFDPLPPVEWSDVEPFRAAMRPAFAGDVDEFVDHNRYYIEADLVFEEGVAILRGAQRVRYTNHSADVLDEIVFRLYANLPSFGGRMVVYRVTAHGTPVEPSIAERQTVLIVPLAEPLAPGEAVEMTLEFSVTAERGLDASYRQFGYQRDVFAGPEWYPMLSVYEAGRGWWTTRATSAGDAVYSETGLYEVRLTAPDSFHVIMSGTAIDAVPNGDGTTTHHYVSGPMRDSLLVAGPNFGKLTDYVDDIAVNVYFWPGGEGAAEWVLRISTDAVRIFSEHIGPYPFSELDVVQTFNLSGVEYPGIVVIADRSWTTGNAFLEITTAHEVAHQWWYSLVGNNQVELPWMDEALTSYTEDLYNRYAHSERHARNLNDNARDRYNYYRGTGAPDLPIGLPVTSYTDNNYGVLVYVKGRLFFLEMEQLLGRDVFFEALRLYFARHRYRVAEPRDMLAAFEDASGQNLSAIFYQWVGNFPGLDPAAIE